MLPSPTGAIRIAKGIGWHCHQRPALLSAVHRGSSLGQQVCQHQRFYVPTVTAHFLQRQSFATTTLNETKPISSTSFASGGDDDIPLPAPPVDNEDFDRMTNQQLADTSTIPGWHLIHSPPRKFPRGALVGTVVSDKMQKTVNVAVDRYRIVPKIRKRLRYTRKFMAHDEQEVARMGDVVMITPCHRISKHKHFLLREVIRSKGQLF